MKLLIILLPALFLMACNSDSQDLKPFEDINVSGLGVSMFSQIQTQIIQKGNCTGCHTAASQAGSMSLDGGDAFDELTKEQSSSQYNRPSRVIPGDPANSLLVQKLSSGAPGSEGRMPKNGKPFDDNGCEIRLVKLWIESGANEKTTKSDALAQLKMKPDSVCDADILNPPGGPVGTPDKEDDSVDEPEDSLFAEVTEKLFVNPAESGRQCTICHNEFGNVLALDKNMAFSELTNEESIEYERPARVVPGDAENSLIVQKLSSNPPQGISQNPPAQMPLIGGFYADNSCEIQLLKLWINAGASETMSKKEALEQPGTELSAECMD